MYCLLLIICMWLVFWIIIEEKTFNGVYVWENRDFAVYSHFVVNGKEEKYMHCFACVQKVFKSWILRFWVVCMRLSRRTCHHPTQNPFPFIPSISFPFPLFMHLSECLRLCLLPTFRFYSYSCWSPSISIFILYTLPFFFTGVILIPKCTYFHL